MAPPRERLPALKARIVLQLLHQIGYVEERRRGSHRKLVAPGRRPIGFAYHQGDEVPPHALRKMLKDNAGLSDEEIAALL